MWKQLQIKYLGKKIPIIKIHGIIDQKMTDGVLYQLEKTCSITSSSLVVSINSRGGLPVQSHIIGTKLRSYAQQKNLKLYTFAGDIAASGGYYILCMGDEVYADRTSLVGNIGALFQKLNLKGVKQRTGIDLNLFSSQDDSLTDIFNPFNDLTPENKAKLQEYIKQAHAKFVQHVQEYRGHKISPANSDLVYSSDIFSGQKAQQIGLVDGIGTICQIMRQKQPESYLQLQRAHWAERFVI